jgi:hypothetical protein
MFKGKPVEKLGRKAWNLIQNIMTVRSPFLMMATFYNGMDVRK